VGFALGLARLGLDTPVILKVSGFEHGYTHGSLLWVINSIPFQYFSVLITIVSAVVMVLVSYLTPAPNYDTIKNLSFGTKTVEGKQDTYQSWGWMEVASSALVLVCILGAYLYFRG